MGLSWTHIEAQPDSKLLKKLLSRNAEKLGVAGQSPDDFEVQIVYTQIDRDSKNTPSFTPHYFNVDEKRYFYPASTVKMPTAFIALEKLRALQVSGLTPQSLMIHGQGPPPQTTMLFDSTAPNHGPSLAHYIKHVFIVSDNNANNRMYEWCGQKYLNETLWEKGFHNSRIVHRIGIGGFTPEDNTWTNPVVFYEDKDLLHYQPLQQSAIDIQEHNANRTSLLRGKAYTTNEGEKIERPFDFSKKNFLSLPDLTGILQRVLFPASFPPEQRFKLLPEDYEFLYQCMSIHPDESAFPAYPQKADSYVKFLMFGDKEQSIPDHIRIFNKVGWAYGFLTDVAYIIDTKNKVEFMLSATIHTNENKTYNDGIYEIEEVALPFLAGLGRVIYDHEVKRKRTHQPDLSRFSNLSYQ